MQLYYWNEHSIVIVTIQVKIGHYFLGKNIIFGQVSDYYAQHKSLFFFSKTKNNNNKKLIGTAHF